MKEAWSVPPLDGPPGMFSRMCWLISEGTAEIQRPSVLPGLHPPLDADVHHAAPEARLQDPRGSGLLRHVAAEAVFGEAVAEGLSNGLALLVHPLACALDTPLVEVVHGAAGGLRRLPQHEGGTSFSSHAWNSVSVPPSGGIVTVAVTGLSVLGLHARMVPSSVRTRGSRRSMWVIPRSHPRSGAVLLVVGLGPPSLEGLDGPVVGPVDARRAGEV